MTDFDRRPSAVPFLGSPAGPRAAAAACALALALGAASPAAAQEVGATDDAEVSAPADGAPETRTPDAPAQDAAPQDAPAQDAAAADAPATAPAEGAPAEDAPAEGAPADDGGLSLGEAAPDGSTGEAADGGVGETYVREEFTDWQMRCVRVPEGQVEPCQLYQLLRDQSGNPVAEVSMFGLPDGGQATVGATVITPLETLLSEQLTVQVDGGQAKRYPFTWCSAIGCFARIGFTDAEVATFRRGNEAGVSIVPVAAPDQRVDLTMSLAGFTAGLEAVNENNEAGREAAGE